jgi:hypothetical protein
MLTLLQKCVCLSVPLPSSPQLLNVEALHTREVRNTHNLLYNVICQIRNMPLLSNATIVLSFESNLAFESQHLLHHLHAMGVQRWVSLAEGAHDTLGWLTTHSRKEAMALILREALRVGRIAYSPHFFSLSMTKDESKRRIADELRNFSVVTEPSKTHFGKPRKTLSSVSEPFHFCSVTQLFRFPDSLCTLYTGILVSWVAFRTMWRSPSSLS